MEKVVVDTDVIIDFFRTREGLLVKLLKLQEKEKIGLFMASVSVFELFGGQSSVGQERELLEFVSKLQVVALDTEIAKLAGEINRDSKYSLKLADLAIGATTITLEAVLATKNKKRFQKIPGLNFFKI